jgi:hypothetical protein
MYKASKNLIINGVEIYSQLEGAINAYKRTQFYDFGYHLGLGIDELVLKGAFREVKSANDVIAYKFLTGLVIPLKELAIKDYKLERLFNIIRDGSAIMTPLVKLMNELEKTKGTYISLKAWLSLQDLANLFMKQEDCLVSKKILNPEEILAVRNTILEVLANASLNFKRFSKDARIVSLFENAYEMYEAKQWKIVGYAIARVAQEIASRENLYTDPEEYEVKRTMVEDENSPFNQ